MVSQLIAPLAKIYSFQKSPSRKGALYDYYVLYNIQNYRIIEDILFHNRIHLTCN